MRITLTRKNSELRTQNSENPRSLGLGGSFGGLNPPPSQRFGGLQLVAGLNPLLIAF